MAREKAFFSTSVSGWERFMTALAANAGDFTHVEAHRGELQLLTLMRIRRNLAHQVAGEGG